VPVPALGRLRVAVFALLDVVDALPTAAVLRVLVSCKHFDVSSHERRVGSGAGVVVVVRDLSVWFPIQQINPSYLPGGSNVHASTQHVVVCDLSVWFPIQQSRLVFASPQTTRSFSPIHPAYHSDRPNPKTIHSFFRRPMEGGTPAT